MSYTVTQPAERARLLDLAERIEGENVARWLAVGANPFRWTDPRYEPAQREIERQRSVRVAREKKNGRESKNQSARADRSGPAARTVSAAPDFQAAEGNQGANRPAQE